MERKNEEEGWRARMEMKDGKEGWRARMERKDGEEEMNLIYPCVIVH